MYGVSSGNEKKKSKTQKIEFFQVDSDADWDSNAGCQSVENDMKKQMDNLNLAKKE